MIGTMVGQNLWECEHKTMCLEDIFSDNILQKVLAWYNYLLNTQLHLVNYGYFKFEIVPPRAFFQCFVFIFYPSLENLLEHLSFFTYV